MSNEGKYELPRCCRKHLTEIKKQKDNDFEFTCSHCMKKYKVKRISDVELGAGEGGWSHPEIIHSKKKAS